MEFDKQGHQILYVPRNKIGAMMSRAMTLFGEHDVFIEVAYPMIMNTVVPREAVLEMLLCKTAALSLEIDSQWALEY